MRIRGRWGEFDAPWVRAIIISEELKLQGHIDFLIDTGASRTTILDSDAARLGIDYQKLEPFPEGTTGIGGVVDTFILPRVKLVFRTEEATHEERLARLFVLRHRPRSVEEEIRIKHLPSLLGRDILNKYRLILDKTRDLAILTDERS